MKQSSFSSLNYDAKKKTTRRELFLAQMEQVVPWSRLLRVLKSYYYSSKPKAGRPPMSLEKMLRIHLMQQWYGLADEAMEDALYEIESMRRFADIELNVDTIPDETTILNFRRLVEKHKLADKIFTSINRHLEKKGLLVSKGTIVDATIVKAASSTKNKDKARDPDMHSTRKNNQYYFGMKVHIGTDINSNAVHSATVTAANESDIGQLPKLLRKDDELVMADAGYVSQEYKRGSRHLGISWQVIEKAGRPKKLSGNRKKKNTKRASIRAKVEHIFRVMKCQFGYTKARYKGLEKNRNQVMMLLALTNLYTQRKTLMG
jgi:IS5 family transposase